MGLGDIIAAREAAKQSIPTFLPLIGEGYGSTRTKPPMDSESFIRVSDLCYICPREEVMVTQLGEERLKHVPSDLQLIFDHGTALHFAVQNLILAKLGIIYGQWRCKDCGYTTGESDTVHPREVAKPRPEKCKECETPAEYPSFEYVEYAFEDRERGLKGHCDGMIKVPQREDLGILEIKSISEYGYRRLGGQPMVDHVLQIHGYMLLSGLEWGTILYWEKGKNGIKALHEHFVERDPAIIKGIEKMVGSVFDGIDNGDLPDKVCQNRECTRAKECCVTDVCFLQEP